MKDKIEEVDNTIVHTENFEYNIKFQEYEIKLILEALHCLEVKEHSNCKWEIQPFGQHWYTPNKKVRRIKFIEKHIKRQVNYV